MINCIGFLPKGIEIEHLKPFVKDEEVLDKLKHLELPIIEAEEDVEDSNEEDFLVQSDQLVYSTPNNTELSYLQFNVYDKEMDDFAIHHDAYIFSTINDAEYLNIGGNHYVALGTFEKNVMLYDALVKNPMAPQILLEGHEGPVMAITKQSNCLYTGSEDCTIIDWDIERLTPKTKYPLDKVVEKLCVSDANVIVYGSKDAIYCVGTLEEIKLKGTIENLCIVGNDVYVGDSYGFLSLLDVRNLSEIKKQIKLSDSALTGLDVYKGLVAASSLDGDLLILDRVNFESKYTHKTKNEIYSVKLSEDNVLFYGDGADNLAYKKLDDFIMD